MILTKFPGVRDELTLLLSHRAIRGRSTEIADMQYRVLADPPLHPAFLRITFVMADGDEFTIDTEEHCEPIARAVTDGRAHIHSGVLH